MNNFNYDGNYPGFVNGEWIVDEKDGHIWISIPGAGVLEGFPHPYSLHLMETPKEYGNAHLDVSDEVMVFDNFKFDSILKSSVPKPGIQDYFETIIGKEITANIPAHVPEGVTIGSIVIKSKVLKKVVGVVNLRTTLSLDILRKVELRFGIAMRVADYGLVSFNNVDLGKGRSMSLDTFFVPAPIRQYQDNMAIFSSPEDYQSFLANLNATTSWFKDYSSMPKYALDSLAPPAHSVKTDSEGRNYIQIRGNVTIKKGFTGVKSIQLPFCPGVNAVIRVNKFIEDGVEKDYLDLTKEKFIDFSILTNFIEVIR